MMVENSVSEAQLKQELKARVSGFRPMVSGRICDMSNHPVNKGDNVYVELERSESGAWNPVRMHAESHPLDLESSPKEIAHAIVKTEIMQIIDGEAAQHGNPEIIDISPKGEDWGEYKR